MSRMQNKGAQMFKYTNDQETFSPDTDSRMKRPNTDENHSYCVMLDQNIELSSCSIQLSSIVANQTFLESSQPECEDNNTVFSN